MAKLLRYGGEYECRDLQYDVQDGDLWKELMGGMYTEHLYVIEHEMNIVFSIVGIRSPSARSRLDFSV